jgi:hypothetical protein
VPTRPCPPDQPIEWWGVNIDLGYSVAFSSWTTAIKETYKATLKENNYVAAASSTYKMGFLQSTSDITGITTSTIAYVGHIFGRLG